MGRQNTQKANLFYLQQTCPILIRSTLTLSQKRGGGAAAKISATLFLADEIMRFWEDFLNYFVTESQYVSILGEWEAVEEHLQLVADEVVFSFSIRLRAPCTSHEESAEIATNSCYLDKEKKSALYLNDNNIKFADPESWHCYDIDSTETDSEQDTISIESMDVMPMLINDYSTISDTTELQFRAK
eukprot:sb/3471364/